MFKTRRNFVMHFCSVHGKDAPYLKPVTEALKTQSAAKRTHAESENNNNNNNNSEPAAKRRKPESAGSPAGPSAGLLTIAEGEEEDEEARAIRLEDTRKDSSWLLSVPIPCRPTDKWEPDGGFED